LLQFDDRMMNFLQHRNSVSMVF